MLYVFASQAKGLAPLVVFALLFGLSYPSVLCSMYAIVPLFFGVENTVLLQGLMLCALFTGSATGSIVAGLLQTNSGSYTSTFAVMVAVMAINFVCSIFLLQTCTIDRKFKSHLPHKDAEVLPILDRGAEGTV